MKPLAIAFLLLLPISAPAEEYLRFSKIEYYLGKQDSNDAKKFNPCTGPQMDVGTGTIDPTPDKCYPKTAKEPPERAIALLYRDYHRDVAPAGPEFLGDLVRLQPATVQPAGDNRTIPIGVRAVVPIYNVPGVGVQLRFSARALTMIFTGRITKWNDAALQATNHVHLPNLEITVVRQPAVAPATRVLTEFLHTEPTGISATGNGSAAALVRQTPGAIGYVDFDAVPREVPAGLVQNATGAYVPATGETVSRYGSTTAYAITGLQYLTLDRSKTGTSVAFAIFLLSQEGKVQMLGAAPLPEEIGKRTKKRLQLLGY